MKNEVIILSICIPTYNRGTILRENLLRCKSQIDRNNFHVELIVSDNASNDNTESICEFFKDLDYFRYLRNDVNIGPNLNFTKLAEQASGKYLWLLGDDDLICPNTIYTICNVLREHDPGLLVFRPASLIKIIPFPRFDYESFFLRNLSIMTHTSSCIVKRESIDLELMIKDSWTFLTHFPQYVRSACQSELNLELHGRFIEDGALGEQNGGYHFFEVFASNIKFLLFRLHVEGFVSKATLDKSLDQFLFNALRSFVEINIQRKYKNFIDYRALFIIGRAFGVCRIFKVVFNFALRKFRSK